CPGPALSRSLFSRSTFGERARQFHIKPLAVAATTGTDLARIDAVREAAGWNIPTRVRLLPRAALRLELLESLLHLLRLRGGSRLELLFLLLLSQRTLPFAVARGKPCFPREPPSSCSRLDHAHLGSLRAKPGSAREGWAA